MEEKTTFLLCKLLRYIFENEDTADWKPLKELVLLNNHTGVKRYIAKSVADMEDNISGKQIYERLNEEYYKSEPNFNY